MFDLLPHADDFSDLPVLPKQILSYDGQIVDLENDTWKLYASSDKGTLLRITWNSLDKISARSPIRISARCIHLIKLFICDRILSKKGSTARNDFRSLLLFCEWLCDYGNNYLADNKIEFSWEDFGIAVGIPFLDWCILNTSDKGNNFSRLRVLYRWGIANNYSDFDVSKLQALEDVIAGGNIKGVAVRFRHITKGPLTDDEKKLISQHLKQTTSEDLDAIIVMFLFELGVNPDQLSRVRVDELHKIETEYGLFYQVDVPRVKKRTAYRETKRRPLSQRLGSLLEFISSGRDRDKKLFYWLSEENAGSDINNALKRWAKKLNLISPSTGEILFLNARRFRYTLATHLAKEGASDHLIAETLDHTDLQNVRIYSQTSPNIADRVEEALDASIKPLFSRFLGLVIENLHQSPFSEDEANELIIGSISHLSPSLNVGGIGLCGKNIKREGLCQLYPPLSCYQCSSFAAVSSGPHEQLLKSLNDFLEVNKEKMDERIKQQLDATIAAISDLLVRLQPRKGDNFND